jgi:EmrB/QacA subfamily drug resistance transporter
MSRTQTVTAMLRPSPTLVLVTTSLGVLLAQLDSMIVNFALKAIGSDLHAGVSALQWMLDIYNLVYASLLLTGGTLGDLYGRRRAFAGGAGLIALGSVICGLSPDTATLIIGRGVTGLGAALVVPTSLAILAAAYPNPRERAHAVGIWASCNGLALALGPTAGGLLVDSAGWRSIFLLTVPLALFCLVMALRTVPESADPRGRHLDLPGQALAISALAALAYAAIEGSRAAWLSLPILGALGLAVTAGAAFFWVEARTQGALVPLDILRHRALLPALGVAGLMTFGMYGMLFLMPVYLQAARGASSFVAALELLPVSATFLIVSNLSGPLFNRFGPRFMTTAGMAFMGLGLLIPASLPSDAPLLAIMAGLFVIGIGLGLNTGPVMSVAVAAVPPARSGTASGLANTARMIGATLGVAVMGAVFAAYAGQSAADAATATHGMKMALFVGGGGELLGALIAFCFIRRAALS